MRFPYLKFPLNKRSAFFGSAILKPIIPVGVSYKGKSLRYGAPLTRVRIFVFSMLPSESTSVSIFVQARKKCSAEFKSAEARRRFCTKSY